MCDPLTFASAGLGGLQAGFQMFGQAAAASAANKAGRANLTAAVDAGGAEQAQQNREQLQADQDDTEKRIQERLAFKAAQATTIAQLDGAEGNTSELLLGDIERQYGQNVGAINRTASNRDQQFDEQKKGINAKITARGTYQKTPGPSFLDAGMALLKVGAQGAESYLKYKPPSTTSKE